MVVLKAEALAGRPMYSMCDRKKKTTRFELDDKDRLLPTFYLIQF